MATPEVNPWDVQVGGSHYKSLAIQPSEYISKNNFGWFRGNAIKYVSRTKGDAAKQIEDLEKAKHYIDLEIEALRNQRPQQAVARQLRESWMELMAREIPNDV